MSDDAAQREAADCVIANGEALGKFCLRALGERGPGFGSMLADPGNTPDARFEQQMDCALRHVVGLLLSSEQAHGRENSFQGGRCGVCVSELPVETVCAGLAYLRERISVPRDMSYPAARQLRAHLTAVIRELSGARSSQ